MRDYRLKWSEMEARTHRAEIASHSLYSSERSRERNMESLQRELQYKNKFIKQMQEVQGNANSRENA